MDVMKYVLLFCLTGFASGLWADTMLWPSDDAELKISGDARISLQGGWMNVRTGTKSRWPGTKLCFKAKERDLSPYGAMKIVASNTTDVAHNLCVSVKNRTMQGSSPGGSMKVPAHSVREIRISLAALPWRFDAPLALYGMRGYPSSNDGGQSFDLRHTYEVHIFFSDPSEPSGFAIKSVSVCGSGHDAKVISASTFFPFVDEYGQFKHDDWPGKIHSDTELKQAAADEEKWLNKHAISPIPESDRFGGWAGGPKFKATGFFRTEKVNGKWWLVDPDGNLFYSHGVDCVRIDSSTPISRREHYFERLPLELNVPGYPVYSKGWWAPHGFYSAETNRPFMMVSFPRANAARKYGEGWLEIVSTNVHRRMKAWGLNTIANWSDGHIYSLGRTPYTINLGTEGSPRLKDSKGWWGALPDPFHPDFARRFRDKAREVAKSMRNDPWCVGVFVDNELSWNNEPRMETVARQYFTVIRKILREELPNHLYLGCRIAWGGPAVYRMAAEFCDVVSVNIYAHTPVRDLPDGACDKPMIIGEFHFGALDRGMFHTGLVPTANQEERARWYCDYHDACLMHSRFVGAHWFQWQDQALTGRGDEENYQIGFTTVTDAPYPEMVEAARDVARTMYQKRYGIK